MKRQIFLILYMLLVNNVFAAYLKNVPVSLTQPDGTVVQCFVTGDEFHRRVHDKDNYTIVHDPVSGYFVYTELKDNQLLPTSYIVGQTDPGELPLVPGYDVLPAETETMRQNVLKSATAVTSNPTKGTFNNIVISIRFSDQDPTSLKESYYEEKFNSLQDLSLKYYFNEVSNKQLNVSSYFFPVPVNDTLFEYQDSYSRNYYSLYNQTKNPEGYQGDEGTRRERILLKNAIESVAGQIQASGINFDSNDDDIIDNIIFVLQGDRDDWGKVLWPAKSTLIYENISIGGKKVGTYNKNLTGWFDLGVLCHEFFHSLGAPDLYRFTDTRIDPVGEWDNMSVAGMQHTSTYIKWKYGKWFDDVPEISGPGTYTLEPVSQNPFACYKIASPVSSTEYFMLEYRKREGMLESSLPMYYNDGLIIYRINAEVASGNGNGPPDELYVYRPDGDTLHSGRLSIAAFSANFSRTLFNNESNPGTTTIFPCPLLFFPKCAEEIRATWFPDSGIPLFALCSTFFARACE